ncbi:MAG: cytochrome B6, partial [Gammaproteobacteria bacterium]|nr:cytochrome B6 [Gammaproteobacteria bacterium]
GRYRVTGDISDTLVFRVPSLRNVALTAPYFHNGSRPTLRDAVSSMGRFQLGKELSDEDVDHLVAFLESLSGDLEGSD